MACTAKFTSPGRLAKQIFVKGMPLMYNEILWAAGTAILNQCYSMRGLEAVAATNISSTIFNVFNVVYMALGVAVGIVVGQKLGAGEMEEARETDTRMIVFAVLSCGAGCVAVRHRAALPRNLQYDG